MKILVVAPKNQMSIFPTGLSFIVSVLKKNGHNVDCINRNLNDNFDDILKGYDFVATGGLAVNYAEIEDIINKAKHSGKKTILGGGIVTSAPELIIRSLKPDYSVLGEGEETIIELLRCIESNGNLENIPGLAFFKNNNFIITPDRKPIMNIDEIPYPDYEALGYQEFLEKLKPSTLYYLDSFDHPRPYPILCSRSCPYSCTFCYHPIGKVYRTRSIDSIIEELRYVIPKYKINILEILDELFSCDKKRLYEFSSRLRELLNEFPWEIKWGCQLMVKELDSDLIKELISSGCYNISLGLESYSEVVLKSMKKRITPEEIHKAVHYCLEAPISLQGNFIFGDKAETKATAKETMDFWKEHSKAGIMLGFVQPYPDSELFRYCIEKGIIKDKLDSIKNIVVRNYNMTEMSNDDFLELKAEILLSRYRFNPYSIPKKVDKETLIIECPHCLHTIEYKNFDVTFLSDSTLIFKTSLNAFNKVMYCRICRRRFWARNSLFQLFINFFIIIPPALMVKILGFVKTIVNNKLRIKLENMINK